MNKFNWQSRWQETVGKTVTGLSDGAARYTGPLIAGCSRGDMVPVSIGSAGLAGMVQQPVLVQELNAVQIETELGGQARCKS